MKRILLTSTLVGVLALTGCATVQSDLQKINVFANKYGPLIGRDLIIVGNILVQAECSPGLASGTVVAGNILNIIAPNSNNVSKVVSALNTNVQVANQLCPLVASVKGTVASIPAGTPTQTVAVTVQ